MLSVLDCQLSTERFVRSRKKGFVRIVEKRVHRLFEKNDASAFLVSLEFHTYCVQCRDRSTYSTLVHASD